MPSPLRDFINRRLASLDEREPLPSPVPEEPPEHAFSRSLQTCPPPPQTQLYRPTLDEARALIDAEIRAYLDDPEPDGMLLVRAAPGTGKTTIANRICHDMADAGRRVLYFAPRHDFVFDLQNASLFNERDAALWYEWQPRKEKDPQTCQHTEEISAWMAKGYNAMDFCSGICGWDYVSKECPYHAQKSIKHPLIMAQHAHAALGHALLPRVSAVFGDEDPQSAFEHWRTIDSDKLFSGFDEQIDFWALVHVLNTAVNRDGITEGPDLFAPDLLGDPQAVATLCDSFSVPLDAQLATDKPHSIEEADRAPVWYAHQLAHILGREARLAAQGRDYPHRILCGNGKLHLLMRHEPADLPPHLVWMDATGNAHLYEQIFRRPVRVVRGEPRLRGSVYQVVDRANGKGTLVDIEASAGREKDIPTEKAKQALRFVQTVVEEQEYEQPLVITYKGLRHLFEAEGFRADHFGGARGTNAHGDCDAVFVVGTPIPPISQLKRTVAMLHFERDAPFNAQWRPANAVYDYVGDEGMGRCYPVGGYWGDEDLEAVVGVVREDEIVQAAHRVRPILAERDVWLLTNIPLDALPPTRLFTLAEALDVPPGINIWKWMDLVEALEGINVLTTRELMDCVGISRPTAYKYMEHLRDRGWREPTDEDGEIIVRQRGRQPKTLVRIS